MQAVSRHIPSIVLLCSYSENPSIFMAILRVREHVNPLSSKYQTPPSIPDWGTIYAHPNLPLHLDIGCARGRFVLQLAQIEPSWNYLGLEIRGPLVDQANQWRTEQGSQNLHYL